MKQKRFEFLEHTADIKFKAYGNTLEQAFENSALALIECMKDKVEIKEKTQKTIKIKATNLEQLLYKFLEEFLFLLDSEDFVLSKIKEIEIDEIKFELKADLSGDNALNYEFANTVKAITYNELFIKKEKHKYITQVVLDV
jgi:SHS2 domain-containing protein